MFFSGTNTTLNPTNIGVGKDYSTVTDFAKFLG